MGDFSKIELGFNEEHLRVWRQEHKQPVLISKQLSQVLHKRSAAFVNGERWVWLYADANDYLSITPLFHYKIEDCKCDEKFSVSTNHFPGTQDCFSHVLCTSCRYNHLYEVDFADADFIDSGDWLYWFVDSCSWEETLNIENGKYSENIASWLINEGLAPGQLFLVRFHSPKTTRSYEGDYDFDYDFEIIEKEPITQEEAADRWSDWIRTGWEDRPDMPQFMLPQYLSIAKASRSVALIDVNADDDKIEWSTQDECAECYGKDGYHWPSCSCHLSDEARELLRKGMEDVKEGRVDKWDENEMIDAYKKAKYTNGFGIEGVDDLVKALKAKVCQLYQSKHMFNTSSHAIYQCACGCDVLVAYALVVGKDTLVFRKGHGPETMSDGRKIVTGSEFVQR